jgi:hypothetical protein
MKQQLRLWAPLVAIGFALMFLRVPGPCAYGRVGGEVLHEEVSDERILHAVVFHGKDRQPPAALHHGRELCARK